MEKCGTDFGLSKIRIDFVHILRARLGIPDISDIYVEKLDWVKGRNTLVGEGKMLRVCLTHHRGVLSTNEGANA